MVTLTLRKATPNDLNLLQTIGRQTFYEAFAAQNTEENMQQYLQEGFATEKVAAELRNEHSHVYFAERENTVIGYMKLNTGPAQTEPQDNNALEIERIYVLKDYHGQQVGQRLYEKAMEEARERGASYVWLGVWEENARAIRFYQKNGFVAFDKHIFRLGDDEQTDILMKRPLTDC